MMVEDFGINIVHQFFHDYAKLKHEIQNVDNFITKSREERDKRSEYYAGLADKYLPQIMPLYRAMECSEDAIKRHVDDMQAKERDIHDRMELLGELNVRLHEQMKGLQD